MKSWLRLKGLTLGRALAVLLLVLAGCGAPEVGRTFPSGTELVYINRTTTPIEVQEGVIEACSESAFDQADIERALKMRMDGSFPPAPPDTVDLTATAHEAPGQTKPLIVVILEGTAMRAFFGSVPDAELPPCQGRAVQPT